MMRRRFYCKPHSLEVAEPFPWLDCRLSRLRSLRWEFFESQESNGCHPCWRINYPNHDREDPFQPWLEGDHFSALSYQKLLMVRCSRFC